jgi:uncharacterized protein
MKFMLFSISMLLVQAVVYGQSNENVDLKKNANVSLFPLSDVQIKDNEISHIEKLNHQYLLSLQPDKLLSWFRREAGLVPKASPYPFWESEDVWGKGPLAGHTLGFYLSSMSMAFESTRDRAIIERLTYTLAELKKCQQAHGDGYLLATIDGRDLFNDIVEGRFTTSNGLINDTWEPVYILNKIMLGLNGVYIRCDLPVAKEILIDLADWFGESVVDKLSHEDLQKLLVCEHGSINESFVEVYELTGEKKYLEWAKRLNDEDMLLPMSEGRDILEGWHANTQIPKFTGFEKVYTHTGEKPYTDAARFFWKTVTANHTWANEGNSSGEHFFSITEFENKVTEIGGPESCNTVNMMRLTEALYQEYAEMQKVDYYERALYNHILANYDPDQGMCTYYTSMRPAHYRVYGTKFESFWCCTGTGMEAATKFAKMIYAHKDSNLFVNLFISSELSWQSKGVILKQTSSFPDQDQSEILLKTSANKTFTLNIRHPYWVDKKGFTIFVNEEMVTSSSKPGEYAKLTRLWKDGDKIKIKFSAKVTAETLPGSNKYVAFFYGPILLATKIDNEGLSKNSFREARTTVAKEEIPILSSPVIFGPLEKLTNLLQRKSPKELRFAFPQAKASTQFELAPFNRIHFSRYTLYFPRFETRDGFKEALRQLQLKERKNHELELKTIDRVIVASDSSENTHQLEAVRASKGEAFRKVGRKAEQGGYFMYYMSVLPHGDQSLYLLFAKQDTETTAFDILIDGKLLTTVNSLPKKENTEKFYEFIVPLPKGFIVDNQHITIKFKAHKGHNTLRLFDLRVVKNDGSR